MLSKFGKNKTSIETGNVVQQRPGQQILPNFAIKILKTNRIAFGTDISMHSIDIDPTVALVNHILESIATLREVNKVYRTKESMTSKTIGSRVLFGLAGELRNILIDILEFNPNEEYKDAGILYINLASSILLNFPEIAALESSKTGRLLLHYAAIKATTIVAKDMLSLVSSYITIILETYTFCLDCENLS